jgi:hypothetical protein
VVAVSLDLIIPALGSQGQPRLHSGTQALSQKKKVKYYPYWFLRPGV